MVLPLLAAGIGAAGNLVGGLMGANAAEQSNKTNQMINIMNAMMRNQERIDAIEAAGKARREDKLGGVDAAGNRTYFDPKTGWTVIPTARTAEMQAAQQAEQAKQVYQDMPMRRRMLEKNYADQLRDRELEQQYIKELPYAKVDPATIRAMLFRDAQSGIQGSFDESTAAALRGAMRRGTSGIDKILSSFARQKADATSDAFSKTGLQAMQVADQMSRANTGQLQNLINFFGGRARGLPAVNTKIDTGQEGADALLKTMSSLGQNTESLPVTTAGKTGATFDYTQPNMGYANTFTQAGQGFANILNAFNSNQNYNEAQKRLTGSTNTWG
jgi:hypothetical protein